MADTPPDGLNTGLNYNNPNAAQQGAFEAPQAVTAAQPVGIE